MRRIAILVLVGLLAVAAGGFAKGGNLGIGAELTSVNLGGVGAMFCLHLPKVPLFFGIGADLAGDFQLALTVDYWLLHEHLTGPLHWYLGLGGYAALGFEPGWFAVGARLPIGLQVWPLNRELLEVFVEVAPAWIPISSSGFYAGNFDAQLALGFRLWL